MMVPNKIYNELKKNDFTSSIISITITRAWLRRWKITDFVVFGLKMCKTVRFERQSFRVSTDTIRLLAPVFIERQSTRLRLVDNLLDENSGTQ